MSNLNNTDKMSYFQRCAEAERIVKNLTAEIKTQYKMQVASGGIYNKTYMHLHKSLTYLSMALDDIAHIEG